MKREKAVKLYNGITNIKDEILAEAMQEQTVRGPTARIKWGAIVAGLVLVLGLCAGVMQRKTAGNPVDTPMSSGIFPNTPPSYAYPLDYDSLGEFKNSMCEENAEKIFAKFAREGMPDEELDTFRSFVEKLRAQNIPAPYADGSAIELRKEDGYSAISLFVSEAYGLPWIFYHPKVSSGENFYIKITYIPETISEKQKNPTAAEVIGALSPNAPNLNHLGESHENIYNQQIKLRDREVTALVYEYKSDKRNSTVFVYGDLLVEVRCDPAVWSDEWFASLSLNCFAE